MTAFGLTIRLGNAEMRRGDYVASALEQVAERLREFYGADDLTGWFNLSGGIGDANGNHVGRWEVAP